MDDISADKSVKGAKCVVVGWVAGSVGWHVYKGVYDIRDVSHDVIPFILDDGSDMRVLISPLMFQMIENLWFHCYMNDLNIMPELYFIYLNTEVILIRFKFYQRLSYCCACQIVG